MGILFQSLPIHYQRFVSTYLETHSLAEAARQSGSKAKNPSQAGLQIIKNADVKAALCEMQCNISHELEISAKKVLNELAKIGFGDLKNIFDEDGRIIPMHELPENVSPTISSIEMVTTMDGDEVVYVKKIRAWDKRGALGDLAKHLGLFDADNTQKRPMVIVKDFACGAGKKEGNK